MLLEKSEWQRTAKSEKTPMHLIWRRSGALKFQKWAKDFKSRAIGAETHPRLNPEFDKYLK